MNRIIRIQNCTHEAFSENQVKNFFSFRDFLNKHLTPNEDNMYRIEEPFYTCPYSNSGYKKGQMAIFVYSSNNPTILIVRDTLPM